MRTRQRLTAVGAVALATSAIGGGAVATSHAMSDSTTPAQGTMTVISMTAGSDGAIKCVYDNIDLPTVRVGTGVDSGKPIAGTVMVSTGSVQAPNGEVPGGAPTLVAINEAVSGTAPGMPTEAGTSAGGAGETTQVGQVPPGLPLGEPIAIDSVNARPGTAEECAALKPTTIPAPPATP